MIRNLTILSIFALAISSCAKQESFTHTITKIENINGGEILYNETGMDTISAELKLQDITLNRAAQPFQIILVEENSSSHFTNIPAKYLNIDAEVEVSRNIYEDYFPKDWEAMKGVAYTTIRIKSKKDNQVFYTQVVHTGTSTEIAHHSEDF